MTDDLAPFFESRETRIGRLPVEARQKFELADQSAVAAGQTDFADRQFVSLWLSRRTGMPRKDITANFDNIAKRYFGDGATAASAWDKIAAGYAPPTKDEDAPDGLETKDEEYADTAGLPKVGAAAFMENTGQSAWAAGGGFENFAQRIPAGLYSQGASALGAPALRNPMENEEYKRLKLENERIESPYQFTAVYDEAMSFGPSLSAEDEARIVANEKRMFEIVRGMDDKHRVAVKEWAGSAKADISKEYRRLANFWYDLSEGAAERWGVDPEFQKTTLGQFMASAGSVPATAALAVMGPGGWAGMEGAFFADVESERMQAEGANYDPDKAAAANLASALPQMALEKAFGVERLMNEVIGELPKMAGRVNFGDFAKRFVKSGLTAGVEEGLTEPAQGFWNDYVASLTYDDKRELLTGDGAKRRLIESVSGFALGFVFGGGVSAVAGVDQNLAVSKGEEYLTTKDGQPMEEQDFRVMRQVKTDAQITATAPDEETGRILLAAVNGDVNAQAEYNKRVTAALFVNTDGVEVEGMALGKVNDSPVARMADGTIIPIDMTNAEDRSFVDNFKKEAVKKIALEETAEFLGKGLEAGREIKISEDEKALKDFVDEAKVDVDEAAKAIGIANDVNAANIPEGTNPEDVRVLGSNVAEYQAGVFKDVSTVFKGGNALTAVEEVAEGYMKKRLAVGDLLEADLTAWREAYESGTETETKTKGTVSNLEWFSKRVVDYAVANRKMPELPKSWASFFRTLGAHLKTILRLSEKMKKLKRDGKLGEEFEDALKGALGLKSAEESTAKIRQRGVEGAARANAETAPTVSDIEADAMAEATETEGFPKITGNEGDGFIVTDPAGEEIGRAQELEAAQNIALKWYDKTARDEEKASARADVFLSIQNPLVHQVGGTITTGEVGALIDRAKAAGNDGLFLRDIEDGIRGGVRTNHFVAFKPTQVKSTGNSGRFDENNPLISFALTGIPQNSTQALQAQALRLRAKKLAASGTLQARITAGVPLPKRAKAVSRSTQASILAKLAMPITARLYRINPELTQRLRRFEFDLGQAISRDFQAIQPFLDAFTKMKDTDARVLDLALKNGDTQTRDGVLQAYGMQAAFQRVEQVLAAGRARGVAAGYEIGQVEDYFPRKVNDLDGLMVHYYGKPQAGAIETAIREAMAKAAAKGQTLSMEERVMIVNAALQGRGRQASKPSNFKGRKTDVVDVDADAFYADSVQALVSYIESVNQAVEKRRFFGKYAVTTAGVSSNQLAIEASIGAYVEDMIATDKLPRAKSAEVTAILEGRFNQGVASQFVKNMKTLSYLGTMGQITSALSQVTDIAFSMYENGVYETMVAAGQAVARKSTITRKSLGLDGIAEEFRDMGKLQKILDLTFKAVGIHYLDLVGKETLVNAKFRKMQKEAIAGRLSDRSRSIINTSFGPAGAQVISDLAAGKRTQDTLFAVYTVLADYQPLSLSEYPEAYLRHPNGRIFYMLKSFTLKQIEAFRREAFSLIVKGDAKQKAIGFRNLIHLAGCLYLMGMPMDWLKDWIMGRDPQLSDIAVDNVFKLTGISRWNLWQFREKKNPLEAALLLIVPPIPFIQYPLMDAKEIAARIEEGEEIEPGEFETWRMLPLVGAPIYWWFGGGKEKVNARKKKREGKGRIGNRS
jgi:hypothetical protein